MTDSLPHDVGALPTPDLLAWALELAEELTERLSTPDFMDDLPRFHHGPQRDRSAEWGLYADDRAGGTEEGADGAGSGRQGAGEGLDCTEVGSVPRGVLPEVTTAVERLSRSLGASQTALAGHVERIFEIPDLREEILGIPPGKTAFRHAQDYLREHLHIDRREAKRRVERAGHVMPTRTVDHTQTIPPRLPVLSESVQHAGTDLSAADLIATTLNTARRDAALAEAPPDLVDEQLVAGERLLVTHAQDVDPETLSKICGHWRQRFDALFNPDGREPTEAELNHEQGLFYRGRRRGHSNGLHRWEIMAADGQHELLQTVAAAASNPRAPGPECVGPEAADSEDANSVDQAVLDPRSSGQRQLDGLISALTGALALADLSDLPSSGGSRPQVLVTIDHDSLLSRVHQSNAANTVLSQAAYVGPIPPRFIRQWACDADLIPVVLGGEGQILDIGRAQRLFPRRLRQALVARDGGCAAPNCSIPAPWCEAHHIDHWERGGPTSVENGVLLCSHHHHAVHSDAWEISVRSGVPWFIPAPYLDHTQRARRNRYRSGGTADPPD
ncbi:HNH endonuclease signature motif containing protein [Citricoccus nitrophenolicus]|uniref:HNH endonuclease signature motif containing protein n=1 Tax=Citricoccus nitrophenolicus TaxID=863575 RepID=UPI0031E53623